MVEEGNANFLDEDRVEGVSDNLYEWTFEQVIMIAAPIPEGDSKLINWNAPYHQHTNATIRFLATQYEVSYGVIVQSAITHGFSMFMHEFDGVVQTLNTLDGAAINRGNKRYFILRSCHPSIDLNGTISTRRMMATTDKQTANALGNVAGILGTGRSHLAANCIFKSLMTSDGLEKPVIDTFAEYVDGFESGIRMCQDAAMKLS
jgi:hypothetical protein